MNFKAILDNQMFWTAMIGWFLAQALKIPTGYLLHRGWHWANFFTPGGMPSSHSALVTSAAIAAGLYHGFDSAIFALAVAVAMVVVYDASGVRRQAGIHAQKINILVQELLKGHPVNQEQLLEVIGHTPIETISGVILGVLTALGVWLVWK
jgi:acid phosphatase family membrane protein YuiD